MTERFPASVQDREASFACQRRPRRSRLEARLSGARGLPSVGLLVRTAGLERGSRRGLPGVGRSAGEPRGRSAAMPVGDHQREQPLAAGELVVRHVAEDGGRTAIYDFGSLPVAAQVASGVRGDLRRRVGPDGTWRSIASSREMSLITLYFARFVAALQPPPSSVKELTPSVWAAFKLSRRPDTTVGSVQLPKMATFLRDHPQLPHETCHAARPGSRSAAVSRWVPLRRKT